MSNSSPLKSMLEAPFEEFATAILPLYHGSQVSVCIGSKNPVEYKLSKDLLCKQSPYFAATFDGNFQESENQSTVLEEIDGVVTNRSFQMLVQWLYHHRVIFGKSSSEDTITIILEFVRLADMCEVTGMESLMAENMKRVILSDNPTRKTLDTLTDTGINNCCFTFQHITSAASLPKGHPVRGVVAAAAVKEYFYYGDEKFIDMANEYPEFSTDIVAVMKATINSFELSKNKIICKEPLN